MLGIGFSEMVVVVVLILIAVGPDKLPTMVKTVAKTYRQFRRTAMDLRASTGIDDFLRDEELKELAELRKQKLLTMSKVPAKPIAKPLPATATAAGAHIGGAVPTAAGGASTATSAAKPHAATTGTATSGTAPTVASPSPVPHAKPGAAGAVRGPTLAQRLAEAPREGVDIAEASRPIPTETVAADTAAAETAARAIPETRADAIASPPVAIPPVAKAGA